MNYPLVSVLLPTYNSSEFITETIEHVLNQTYHNFEFIIVDDASTDNTLEITQQYASKDQRIKIFQSKKNEGISATHNKCIQYSNGKYLAYLNHDDLALPDRLKKQVDFLEKNLEIGVCGSSIEYFGNSNHIWHTLRVPRKIKCNLLFSVTVNNPSAMVRKELFEQHQFLYDTKLLIANDYDMWIQMSQITQLANLPEVLTKIRIHANNTSKNKALLLKETFQLYAHQLQNYLHINPTQEELEVHYALANIPEQGFTLTYVQQASAWLHRLAAANAQYQYYPEPEFTQLLTQLWEKNTAGLHHLGWTYGKLVQASQFSEYKSYSTFQKMKFWVKCLIFPLIKG